MAKATHTVKHPKQYLSIGGKLVHVPAGKNVTLTPDAAKRLEAKGAVFKVGEEQTVEVGSGGGGLSAAETTRIGKLHAAGVGQETIDAAAAINVTTINIEKALKGGASAEVVAEAIKAGVNPETGKPADK